MNQTRYFPRNWIEGEFRFEEDHQKRPLEKPHEVDEACYSLEDSSPDLDETPAFYFGGNRITGEYRRSDSGQERSFPSDDSETTFARVVEKEFKAFDHRLNNVNAAHPSGAGRMFPSEDSEPSEPLIPRGVSECFPSEDQLIPDFDHLLSIESETGEESSEDVKRMCQEMVQAGHNAHQIYDEIYNRSRFNGKLYDLGAADSFDDVSADGSDEDLSWTEEECESVVEMMRASVQCADDSCNERKCQLGRRMIDDIESDLESEMMTLPTRRLLSAIIDHSATCDDTSCAVRWCSFFTQYRELQWSVEEKRASLQSWYRRMQLTQDFEELNADIPDTADFIQLDPDVVWPCVEHNLMHGKVSVYSRGAQPTKAMAPIPRNGIDFLVNGNFSRYGQLGLTALSTTICRGAIMLNIVQYVTSENSKDLWRSLIGLKHENIVRHLWVCVDGNNITLCRDHSCMDSESLESLVKKVKAPHRLADDQIIRYITDLVSATRFLNDEGIFYLRWIASGIQLNNDYTLARLSDFSSAVNSSVIEEDEEVVDVIVNSLPPYILPPEIFSGEESFGRIGAYTEVWGVGCVIYHMCCQRPLHHAMRHQPPETLLEKVAEFAPENHFRSIKSRIMLQILSKIFTYEADRISLSALEKLLQESLSTNRR